MDGSPMTPPEGIDPALWSRLEAEARVRAKGREPAHDFFHVERVVQNTRIIARGEKLAPKDGAVAATAALLHELYALPKNHPDSKRAGDICAEHALELLACENAPRDIIERVAGAIRDHAFSKGVVPDALASRILQDADRLDALGAIGLARMWATSADMRRPFYAPEDPFCDAREPNDKEWGLDHVWKKLLAIPERLHTETAKTLARPRIAFIQTYLDALKAEITAS
jgi:uncharacterized protein